MAPELTVCAIPDSSIGLLVGDMGPSTFEDELSMMWDKRLSGEERPFRVITAFYRLLMMAARRHEADFVLLDVGPNLGAINRAALVATDHVVIPMAADLFSLQGLENLGPALRKWRAGWQERRERGAALDLEQQPHLKPLQRARTGRGRSNWRHGSRSRRAASWTAKPRRS